MRAIWGQIEAVVNQPNAPRSLRLKTTTPAGSPPMEFTVGADPIVTKGSHHLTFADVRVGEFALVTLRNDSSRLEAERIDIIVFG